MFDFGIQYVTVCEATAHLPRAGYIVFRDRSLAYYFGSRINWIRKGGTTMFDFGIRHCAIGFLTDPNNPHWRQPYWLVEWRTGGGSFFIEVKDWLREWRLVKR